MEKLETESLKKLKFEIPFYKRYVDDCILAVPSNKENDILNTFNSFHPRLQFTIENENENNSISFLDILLTRKDQNVHTDWFFKTTHSERYLNFNSIAPVKYKISVVNGLVDRCHAFSEQRDLKTNLIKIKDILKK